ncbi:MAG TPA: hypothetical protein HPP79_11030 [Gammaproteobacteria bacterium]|jgi:hypothetical protein|nr:hypothetical protein [Gammaproteobacteria bacterium]HIJ49084.1 hypothetical protein [Gammaproteobacteria bacterium]
MAAHHGNSGSVKVGSNVVALIQSYSYDENIDLVEATSMGDTEETYISDGITKGGGNVECYWDETDTNGQGAMTPGSTVTLHIGPEGLESGDTERTGSAKIEAFSISGSKGDIVTASFTFKGVLDEATVA